MQAELNEMATVLSISITGINENGFDSGNPLIPSAGDLAMLQDVEDVNVWEAWAVTYRDVVIVGPDGMKLGVFNLTENNLNDEPVYEELKAMLLEAATAPQ